MIAIDLARLIQLTPKPVVDRARSCISRVLYNRVRDSDDAGFKYLEVILRSRCQDSDHSYLTVVRFDRFGVIKNPVHHPTWVRCSCPYFLYYVEVALSRHGSTSVYYSNGMYPMIRNPKLRPYMCKHLISSVNPAVHTLQQEMRAEQKKTEGLGAKIRKLPGMLKRLLRRGRDSEERPGSDII